MEYTAYNPNQLLKFAANDQKFVVEILQMFVQQADEERERIVALAERGNWEDLKFVAHRLRSSAGSVGASNIAKDAAAIETYLLSSKAGIDEQNALVLVERFRKNSERELAEIKEVVNKLCEEEK